MNLAVTKRGIPILFQYPLTTEQNIFELTRLLDSIMSFTE